MIQGRIVVCLVFPLRCIKSWTRTKRNGKVTVQIWKTRIRSRDLLLLLQTILLNYEIISFWYFGFLSSSSLLVLILPPQSETSLFPAALLTEPSCFGFDFSSDLRTLWPYLDEILEYVYGLRDVCVAGGRGRGVWRGEVQHENGREEDGQVLRVHLVAGRLRAHAAQVVHDVHQAVLERRDGTL